MLLPAHRPLDTKGAPLTQALALNSTETGLNLPNTATCSGPHAVYTGCSPDAHHLYTSLHGVHMVYTWTGWLAPRWWVRRNKTVDGGVTGDLLPNVLPITANPAACFYRVIHLQEAPVPEVKTHLDRRAICWHCGRQHYAIWPLERSL